MFTGTVAGRIGNVKPLARTNSGDAVLNFSVAVDQGKSNGEKRQPLWVEISLWEKQAETLAPYIRKGDPIAASGQVGLRTYEVNGETRTAITLQFARVTLLGSANKDARQPGDEREDVGF